MLKVYCTDADQDSRETAALEHIESILATPAAASHEGQNFVRRLLDRFTISNPKAVQPEKPNVCLVFKPMGMSLSDMETHSYGGDGIPVDLVKGLTMYLLAGLDFLHSKANLVHTGESITKLPEKPWPGGLTFPGRYSAWKYHVLNRGRVDS